MTKGQRAMIAAKVFRPKAASPLQEKADLFKESIGSRLMLEEHVVSTREDNETGSGDACGQLATRLEGSYDVVPHMHDKRRRLHLGQKINDIEIAADIEISGCAVGRGRFQL